MGNHQCCSADTADDDCKLSHRSPRKVSISSDAAGNTHGTRLGALPHTIVVSNSANTKPAAVNDKDVNNIYQVRSMGFNRFPSLHSDVRTAGNPQAADNNSTNINDSTPPLTAQSPQTTEQAAEVYETRDALMNNGVAVSTMHLTSPSSAEEVHPNYIPAAEASQPPSRETPPIVEVGRLRRGNDSANALVDRAMPQFDEHSAHTVSLLEVHRSIHNVSPLEVHRSIHNVSPLEVHRSIHNVSPLEVHRSIHNVSPLEVHASNPLSLPPFHRHSGNSFRQLAGEGGGGPQMPYQNATTFTLSTTTNTSRLSINKSMQSLLSSIGGTVLLAEDLGVQSQAIRLPHIHLTGGRREGASVVPDVEKAQQVPPNVDDEKAISCVELCTPSPRKRSGHGEQSSSSSSPSDLRYSCTHRPHPQMIANDTESEHTADSQDSAHLYQHPSASGWLRDKPAVVIKGQQAVHSAYGDTFRHLEGNCFSCASLDVSDVSETPSFPSRVLLGSAQCFASNNGLLPPAAAAEMRGTMLS